MVGRRDESQSENSLPRREISYPEIALNDLKEVAEDLADVAIVEQAPALEGRTMLMVLAPGKAAKKK